MVKTRKLPVSTRRKKPKVIMKLDIEGWELEVVPDIIMEGALAAVDEVIIIECLGILKG